MGPGIPSLPSPSSLSRTLSSSACLEWRPEWCLQRVFFFFFWHKVTGRKVPSETARSCLALSLAHSILVACGSLSRVQSLPTARPLCKIVWAGRKGGEPERGRGRQRGWVRWARWGMREGGAPNCTSGERLANNLICILTSVLRLCLSPKGCGWNGRAPGGCGKRRRPRGPPAAERHPGPPTIAASAPVRRPLLVSANTSFPPECSDSVREWKTRRIYRWERERMDGWRRELYVSSSWHYWVRKLSLSFEGSVVWSYFFSFWNAHTLLTHTFGRSFLILFFFFSPPFLVRVANLPVSSQPPPNKSSCGFFVLSLFPPLKEG